jgi:hypothetical protein
MTTSSPVTVLMSWYILATFTPVTSWTRDSNIGRANSSSCFRTCLIKSLPFSGDNDLPSCRSASKLAVAAGHMMVFLTADRFNGEPFYVA